MNVDYQKYNHYTREILAHFALILAFYSTGHSLLGDRSSMILSKSLLLRPRLIEAQTLGIEAITPLVINALLLSVAKHQTNTSYSSSSAVYAVGY